jgi:hypothetical protein
MFSRHVIEPGAFVRRFVALLPEYLPGVDTGAFEPSDTRRCWNKTLRAILTVIAKDAGLNVEAENPTTAPLKDQSSVIWQREGVPVFAMATGWGNRSELETCFGSLEAFKCPQKLFVYSCAKWQEAVLDQIGAALLRYPYHVEGEQYLFMNLVGGENRLYLQVAGLDRNGPQTAVLKPVEGSPFGWKTGTRGAKIA